MNTHRRHFSFAVGTLTLAAAFIGLPAHAADDADAKALVQKAQATVNAFAKNPDFSAGFGTALGQAKGVLIFPQILKAGFVLGGSGGSGVLMVRDEKTGSWSGPAFYTMGSASFGFQAGASSAEVVMLVHTQKALDSVFASKVKLGADASVAAWKKGMDASAALGSDFVAFSMVKGAFAGLAVDGSVIDVRDSLNAAYYGKPVTPQQILVGKEVRSTGSAGLQAALKHAAK